ncbi:MAG: hypothetical protein JXK07_02680 [Spirochaetes bacterium]|nr:hypothetical protein [Spirochaetota bacterium]MBN2770298.1 hypothetical protein [Spirochaetota bacterium]
MKKFFYMLLISSVVVCISTNVVSKNGKIQSVVSKGTYVPADPIKRALLPKMPVPASYEDYAILQSIDETTNIVIGKFSQGIRRITWISDNNNDGKVDTLIHYFTDDNNFHVVTSPEKIYSTEAFNELKLDIINGSQKKIASNKEGINFYKVLMEKHPEMITVAKDKKGYRINLIDPDDRGRVRATLSCSNNGINGNDLVLQLNYRHRGNAMLSPVIVYGVYCSNSKDPVVKEAVSDILDYIQKRYPTI